MLRSHWLWLGTLGLLALALTFAYSVNADEAPATEGVAVLKMEGMT